jgi:hypothetical protein
VSAPRQNRSAIAFRAGEIAAGLALLQIVHQGTLQERPVAKVFPSPEAKAVREKKLLLVDAFLEIFVAVVAVVQDARPRLLCEMSRMKGLSGARERQCDASARENAVINLLYFLF